MHRVDVVGLVGHLVEEVVVKSLRLITYGDFRDEIAEDVKFSRSSVREARER